MSDHQMFEIIVRDVKQITVQVKHSTLASPIGIPLPGLSGGSRITVRIQDSGQHYSNAHPLMGSSLGTTSQQITVCLESSSKGGLYLMHQQVRPGDTLTVSTPNNLFVTESRTRKHLLIANSIGIASFLSYIPELEQRQADWQLHYCLYDADNNTFVDAFNAVPWRDRVDVHVSALGSRLDLSHLFADPEPGTRVYTCDPAAFNEAVKAAAERHQVSISQLHLEQFIVEDKGGEASTLMLVCSGHGFTASQDMTILQVIENDKVAKMECLCREGMCGACKTMILGGGTDHRDQYRSKEERTSQWSMLVCYSCAKGSRLVLDLQLALRPVPLAGVQITVPAHDTADRQYPRCSPRIPEINGAPCA